TADEHRREAYRVARAGGPVTFGALGNLRQAGRDLLRRVRQVSGLARPVCRAFRMRPLVASRADQEYLLRPQVIGAVPHRLVKPAYGLTELIAHFRILSPGRPVMAAPV